MNVRQQKQPGQAAVESGVIDSERPSRTAGRKDRVSMAFQLKKILVPLDFSVCSKKALQYAVPFAKQFKAKMFLLHAIPVHYGTRLEFDLVDYEPLIEEDVRKNIEARLAALAEENVPGEIPVEIKARHGAPSTEIVNAAKEMDADLIVMSTHGHTGRLRALIGCIAEDVARLAPCPVLVVHEHEHEFAQSQSDNPFATGQRSTQPH
jgi:universal stress protein A